MQNNFVYKNAALVTNYVFPEKILVFQFLQWFFGIHTVVPQAMIELLFALISVKRQRRVLPSSPFQELGLPLSHERIT